MPTPNIKFNKGKNGLGRPLPGEDYISALIFYTAALPSGFTTTNNIKQLFQVSDAISAGILNNYSDATAAQAEYLITAAGATGDEISISVKDIDPTGNLPVDQNGNSLPPTLLCAYVKQAGDTTIAILGASIAAAINAGTLTHGYSAAFVTATLTITAPKKFGIFLNTGSPLIVTIVGAIAGTITQFSGGTFSALAFYYYHISEFFRLQPGGNLYVGFFPVPGLYTFAEVNTIQNFSTGKIRQVGVYKDFASEWSSNDLTALHNACVVSDTAHKNISALYAADMISTADISTLIDLSTLTANKSSIVIVQDAGGQGNFLYKTSNKSVSALGAVLGAVAFAKVSESIGWVEKFNFSDENELEVVGFSNGQPYSSAAISDNLISSLDDRRYILFYKPSGVAGTYVTNANTAIAQSSDYAYIEDNRTIDKAIRGIYSNLVPSLNGPLTLKADGTLTDETVAALESAAAPNLDAMVRNGELSDYSVVINPNQMVLVTEELDVTAELLQQGVARQIVVNIGFVPKIS
jgi:hypothetical protein